VPIFQESGVVPADYEIDVQRAIVLSRAWGRVLGEEFVDHQKRLRRDPDFKPHFDQLWDCRDVESTQASAEDMRELAANNPFTGGSRRAVVAPSNAVFGLSRMFEILTEDTQDEFKVFRDWDEARSWLGLDET
jgi:hypothetical protein